MPHLHSGPRRRRGPRLNVVVAVTAMLTFGAGCGSQTPSGATLSTTPHVSERTVAPPSQAEGPTAPPSVTNPSPASVEPTQSVASARTPDELFAAPPPDVSGKALLAAFPPVGAATYDLPVFDSRGKFTARKEVALPGLSEVGMLARGCVNGSPAETKAERTIEREIDCTLAVALAWRAYQQVPSDSERFDAARLLYGYAVTQLERPERSFVESTLRAQLPLIDGAPLQAPPVFRPGTSPSKKLLASPDASVSSIALLTAIRDRWASRLAGLAAGEFGGWFPGSVAPDWAAPPVQEQGQFSRQVYYYDDKTWRVATQTGVCLHVLTTLGPDLKPGRVEGDGNGNCEAIAYDAWWHFRVLGDPADYDLTLLALRYGFDKVDSAWQNEIPDTFR